MMPQPEIHRASMALFGALSGRVARFVRQIERTERTGGPRRGLRADATRSVIFGLLGSMQRASTRTRSDENMLLRAQMQHAPLRKVGHVAF